MFPAEQRINEYVRTEFDARIETKLARINSWILFIIISIASIIIILFMLGWYFWDFNRDRELWRERQTEMYNYYIKNAKDDEINNMLYREYIMNYGKMMDSIKVCKKK